MPKTDLVSDVEYFDGSYRARIKVPGGWIYETYGVGPANACCFIPDYNHKWTLRDRNGGNTAVTD